ncbi:phosphoribosyltransferase domain-containing protein [Specibacter sp. NPDC057265]|uniref:phosphoribosyltransferase domain-containing protein n=1 Tax=Specibacter sp. NPDC057265 TaxID=3346075 RepID=UPI003642DD0A
MTAAPTAHSLTADVPWNGDFVARELGVRLHSDPAAAVAVAELVGLALRRNPKRAHLLVSTVLAKHIPAEPALVMAAGALLGAFVAAELEAALGGGTGAHNVGLHRGLSAAAAQLSTVLHSTVGQRGKALAALTAQLEQLSSQAPEAIVIGYAETATGLGRLVANALGAFYIHSTRHATPGVEPSAGFQEGHSHATSHAMVPTSPQWLDGDGPVVLVDDEFSTGSTVINTIRELHALVPHSLYVVAALIDLRSAADKARFEALAAELDCRIKVTALGTGHIELGSDILGRAAELIAELPPVEAGTVAAGRLSFVELSAAQAAPIRSDRFGNAAPPDQTTIAAIARQVAAHLQTTACQGPVAVVGCEENMFLPLAVSHALEALLPGTQVLFSTTTRSPIVPVDTPGYAVNGALSFASHDLSHDGPGIRFAYNLNGSHQRPGTIVVFPEPGTPRNAVVHSSVSQLPSLGAAMATAARDAVVVLLPADIPSPCSTTAPRQESSAS